MMLSIPRAQSDVRILEEDTLQDRLAALDLSASLRASVVSGLVKPAGASEFLNHFLKSELQDRVTVHYRTSTRLDLLSYEFLQNIFPLSVTGSSAATHMVVAVLYGSQAFLVINKKKNVSAEKTDQKDIIKNMISFYSQKSVISGITEKLKTNSLYNYTVFSDGDVLKITHFRMQEQFHLKSGYTL